MSHRQEVLRRIADFEKAALVTMRPVDPANKGRGTLKSANWPALAKYLPPKMFADAHDLPILCDAFRFAHESDPVLILGETGSGKSYYADFIARQRKQDALYTVNCGMIPETLIESHIFGHKKGAFTGAESDRAGAIAEAGDGTLFIDEFQEAPKSVYAKLKTFIETGEYHPIGIDKARIGKCRIVFAMNCPDPIKAMPVDFYYRIPYVLRLSPLRERIDSLRQFVHYCLGNYFRQDDATADSEHLFREVGWSRKIESRLFKREVVKTRTRSRYVGEYQWPGNFREAANWVRKMVVLDREIWPPDAAPVSQGKPDRNAAASEIVALRNEGKSEDDVARIMVAKYGRGRGFSAASIRRKYKSK